MAKRAFLHSTSLADTVNAVNEAWLFERPIAAAQATSLAKWIAKRQGKPHAYADTFALFDRERKNGIRLFTGERASSASARHLAGEESCRALRILAVTHPVVERALERAAAGLTHAVERASEHDREAGRRTNPGTFCCGPCTVGFWRHIVVGGFDRREERLRRGMKALRAARSGAGKWGSFPFWYAVSALVDIDLPQARAELKYAAPILTKAVARSTGKPPFGARRVEIARQVLALI